MKIRKRKKNIEMQHLNWNSILDPNLATDLGQNFRTKVATNLGRRE